jgi:hypothetical protein
MRLIFASLTPNQEPVSEMKNEEPSYRDKHYLQIVCCKLCSKRDQINEARIFVKCLSWKICWNILIFRIEKKIKNK